MTSADGELTSVVGKTEVTYKISIVKIGFLIKSGWQHTVVPLTTVTIVVEPIFVVPVGENEFEADSKGGAEVERIGITLEKVEVVEVLGMEFGEDVVNINVDVVRVVIVGVAGSCVIESNIDGTGTDIVLVFVC